MTEDQRRELEGILDAAASRARRSNARDNYDLAEV